MEKEVNKYYDCILNLLRRIFFFFVKYDVECLVGFFLYRSILYRVFFLVFSYIRKMGLSSLSILGYRFYEFICNNY